MSEVDAKRLEAKAFKNLRVEEPKEKVASIDGVVFPPITSLSVGVEEAIPIRPSALILKKDTAEDDATLKIGFVSPALPMIETRDEAEVVPIARAVSHPEPMTIAVSVATPPEVTEPMLIATMVPVAVVEDINGMLIPLKIPPGA